MEEQYSEEEEFYQRIRNGDQAFIRSVFDQYWETFRPFIMGRADLEEEEVREIYVQAFTVFYANIKNGKLKPPLRSTLKSYLFAIGKNYLHRYWKDNNRGRMIYEDNLENLNINQKDTSIDDHYDKKDKANFVKKLLNQLSEKCQQLLLLTYFEEYADDAIAKKMDIPTLGAVRQQRFKCLEKLRGLF